MEKVSNDDCEILEENEDYIKAKLPFIDIPVKMNHGYYAKWINHDFKPGVNDGRNLN